RSNQRDRDSNCGDGLYRGDFGALGPVRRRLLVRPRHRGRARVDRTRDTGMRINAPATPPRERPSSRPPAPASCEAAVGTAAISIASEHGQTTGAFFRNFGDQVIRLVIDDLHVRELAGV